MAEMFPLERLPQADFPQEMLSAGGYATEAEKEKHTEHKKKAKEPKEVGKKHNKSPDDKNTDNILDQNDQVFNTSNETSKHDDQIVDESHQKAAIKVQAKVCFS